MKHRLLSVLPLVAASLLACSSEGPKRESGESVSRVSSPVIKGKNSDASQDAVVLLIHYDPKAGQVASCTGTLLSPRLVLTARHCVADTDESAACDVDGTPLAQGVVRGNHPANTLYVFTGPTRPDFGSANITPAGVGMKVLDDGGKNLCNHDIAMVVLKDPVANAKIAPIRLDGDIIKDEIVTAIGWGVTDKTPEPLTRQQRTGIKILEIGPNDTGNLPVPPNEFQVGESICSGDSGGPAIADTGAIIGVVSRGGNATRPDPNDPSSGCINGENLYTKVAPFKDFILGGFEIVNADPWLEGAESAPLSKGGTGCAVNEECRSQVCAAADPDQPKITTCTEDCLTAGCPTGEVCTAEGVTQVCRPSPNAAKPTTTTSGCATGAGSTSSNGVLGFALAALGLVALRRRRA